MSSTRTIGLWAAILININVIVGSGIFVNLHPLTAALGSGSFVVYLIAALFLLPVVTVLALLARQHPESGGLYVYIKTYLNPFVGFLGGWGYFVGKAISSGFMASMLVMVLKESFPVLHVVPHTLLVAGLLLFLAAANSMGASLQGRIQWFFIVAKVLPVLSVLAILFWHGPQVPISCSMITVDSLAAVVPIAVFAMVGFEVTSTIAHLFVRPEYTILRASLAGFLIVAVLLALFQGGVSALLPASALTVGLPAAQLSSVAVAYLPGFTFFSLLMTACVYLSMLGGTFGILTSNCWNMHRLATQGHVPGGAWLTRVTAGNVPWVSLLVEVFVCALGVAISSKQVPLQKMSVLGVIFAFFCAMLAAWFARDAHGKRLIHPLIVGAALCSTLGLFGITLYHIYLYGVSIPYLCLFGAGVALAVWQAWRDGAPPTKAPIISDKAVATLEEVYTPQYCLQLEAAYGPNMMSEGGIEGIKQVFPEESLQRGGRFLDVGAGLGGTAFYLAENYNIEVTGIDVNPWLVAEATRRTPEKIRGRVNFVLATSANNWPLEERSFDVIYSRGTFVHIPDKKALFAECRRLLKADGLLIITDCLSGDSKAWGPHVAKLVELEKLPLFAESVDGYVAALEHAGFVLSSVRDDSTSYKQYNRDVILRLESLVPQEGLPGVIAEAERDAAIAGYEAIIGALESGEIRLVNFVAKIKD